MGQLFLMIIAVLITCTTVEADVDGTKPVRANRKASVFAKDARFAKLVTLDKPVASLGELVREMHKQTGADIAVQGVLLNRALSMQVDKRSALLVAEDLALLFGGVWVKREGAYIPPH